MEIEVRLNGKSIDLEALSPELVLQVGYYRLLRHMGLSLEEIRWLTHDCPQALGHPHSRKARPTKNAGTPPDQLPLELHPSSNRNGRSHHPQ